MHEPPILFTHPWSRGRIVRWMLEEVGEPYEVAPIQYGAAMKSADYRAINPMGKVPALRHGARVVTECPAICAYLADAFAQAGLAPGPADRADYYRWLFFCAGPLEAAVVTTAMHFEVPDDQQAMAGWGSLGLVLDTLEQCLTEREFVAGASFTAADLYLAAQLGWGMRFGTIDERPAFGRYFERMSGREAYVRANEKDDLLAAQLEAQGG